MLVDLIFTFDESASHFFGVTQYDSDPFWFSFDTAPAPM